MDATTKLLAIEDIKILKARYFRAIDTKDAVLLRSVFTDDVSVDMRGAAVDPATGINYTPEATQNILQGRDYVVAEYQRTFAPLTSVHHGMQSEITFTSAETATGLWAMADLIRFPEPFGITTLRGYGHYHDTYALIGRDWKIQTTRLTRLLVEVRKR